MIISPHTFNTAGSQCSMALPMLLTQVKIMLLILLH